MSQSPWVGPDSHAAQEPRPSADPHPSSALPPSSPPRPPLGYVLLPPYLDLYTYDSRSARAHELHAVVASNRADDVAHGAQATPITYRTVGVRMVGQYLNHFKASGKDDAHTEYVTVLLVGNEVLDIYYSNFTRGFDTGHARAASAGVIGSLAVRSASSSSTPSPSPSSTSTLPVT